MYTVLVTRGSRGTVTFDPLQCAFGLLAKTMHELQNEECSQLRADQKTQSNVVKKRPWKLTTKQ